MASRWGKNGNSDRLYVLGLQNQCHKIKRHLLLGRKAMRSLLLFFSRLVMFDTLWSHGLQHTGFPCPSPSPGACLNSCPLSRWCHPTILSSVVPFSSCLQSFPASASFPKSHLFASGSQSIGASAEAVSLSLTTLWETVKDREAWRAAVYGATKSRIWRSDWTATWKL